MSQIICGEHSYGSDKIQIFNWGQDAKLNIGRFCSVADNVKVFLGGTHRTDWVTTFPLHAKFNVGEPNNITNGDINIGNDVYICNGVTIMSGVTIGDGAVIAANSHVVSDVAPFSIVGGNPAKHIRFRFDQNIIELLMKLKWWEFSEQIVREISKSLCSAPIYEDIQHLVEKYRS